jgi:hypothetical protein
LVGECELNEEEGNLMNGTSSVVDKMIGKYKNEEEMKIGDRSIDELVEIKEKNN